MIFRRDDDDCCNGPSFKQSLVLAIVAALVPSIGQMMVDAMNNRYDSKKSSEENKNDKK
jgi:hypothetical protein